MFKLLVLSTIFAATAAKPDVLLSAPAAYGSPLVSPIASTYLHSSSYLDSPAVDSDLAYPHWIKKRAAQLFDTYVTPSTYIAGTPLVAPAPITYASSVLPTYAAPAHLIKKRSAQLLDVASPWSSYIASDPLVSSAIIPSASYYSTYPGYAAAWPLVKK